MPTAIRQRASRWRRIGGLFALFLVLYGLAAWGLDAHGQRRPAGRFDAIVVAGCRVMPDGRPSPALARRTELAVELYRAGVADRLIFTGGVGDESTPSEAASAARYARALAPGLSISLEQRSTSTEENARFAAQLLGPESRVVVVSDAYHVFRCRRVFGRYFERVVGAGSLGDTWPRIKGALREVVAVAAYAVLGRL